MKIEIWSDFACPFCYIGKTKLDEALSEFAHSHLVEVQFKSYQLDPTLSAYTGQDFFEVMGAKFGSIEKAKQMMYGIAEQAKEVGLEFNFDTMKPTNTFKAHRLAKLAKKYDKETVVTEAILYANFTESKDIGNTDVLADIGEYAGIDREEVLRVLQDKNAYEEEVNHDIIEARQLGVSGVPYFVFNRKYAVSGAQPTEAFKQVLEQVWKEEHQIPQFKTITPENESGGTCGTEGCDI